MMVDPVVAAGGIGVVASPVAGRALVHGIRSLPQHWRRKAAWALVGAALSAALLAEVSSEGPMKQGAFVVLLGLIPGLLAYVVWRTALASAVVSLVPLYFGIGALTLGRPLHAPELALDRAVPLQPAWMLVYGSLSVFVLLPLLVVRRDELFRRALRGYLTVLVLAYIGFATYPTAAPRPPQVPGEGFAAWSLRLQYSLDWRYNCFPSLHVAHSFVSALTCYRVDRRTGLAALSWASLIGVSTLFTKQHYVLDVVAGTLAAGLAYALFLRGYPREAVPEADRRQAAVRAMAVVAIYGALVGFCWILYLTGRAYSTIS